MSVVQYEQPPPLPPSRPGDELQPGPVGRVARLRAAAEYAAYIADTEFVPEQLRGNRASVAAALLAGEEVGLEPMATLRLVSMIKGMPTFKAEALRGMVTSRGHELWLEESTTTRAIAAGRRAGQDRIGRVTWTLDDAKRAGIAGQHNWRTYPREMLVARATAALARQMFADVIGGLAAAEELEDEPDNGPPATPPPPPPDAPAAGPPAGRTRRRRPAKADPPASPAAAPLPPTPPPDEQPEPPAPLATEAYKKKIFATMRDVGLTGSTDADRERRLAYTSRVIGRKIASSNELTLSEASLVIDDLEQIAQLPADQRAERLAGASSPERQRLHKLLAEKAIGTDAEQLSYAGAVLDDPVTDFAALSDDDIAKVTAHLEQYDSDNPQTWPFPDGF